MIQLPTSTLLHTQDTQRLPESTQESGHQYKNPIEASTLQISQTTIQELDKRRSILLGPRKIGPSLWTKSDYGVVTTNTIRVKCECGANDEDGRMVSCVLNIARNNGVDVYSSTAASAIRCNTFRATDTVI